MFVDFVFGLEKLSQFKIILKYVLYFRVFKNIYYKLQFCLIHDVQYIPFICDKGFFNQLIFF